MALYTPTKWVFCYGQLLDPSVTASFNGTALSGFSEDNLLYDKPNRPFKTNDTASRSITFSAPGTQNATAFAIMQHNLFSTGRTWVELGGGYQVTLHDDGDRIALSTNNVADPWSINWASGSGQLRIGGAFVGQFHEMSLNPTDARYVQKARTPLVTEETLGGSLRVMPTGYSDRATLEIFTRRAKQADVAFFSGTMMLPENRQSLCAVFPPNETYGTAGIRHFVGYLEEVDVAPRASVSGDTRYDLTVRMIGV